MTGPDVDAALARIVATLTERGVRHALVGGLAASIRGEVRFTRDVDLAIVAETDAEVESLVRDLRADGYGVHALVENDATHRIALVRLRDAHGVLVDLLAQSSGIEAEVVDRADEVGWRDVGTVRVAASEELLALKVLAMNDRRLQDTIDARNIVAAQPALDVDRVRANLELIRARSCDRGERLLEKLDALLEASVET